MEEEGRVGKRTCFMLKFPFKVSLSGLPRLQEQCLPRSDCALNDPLPLSTVAKLGQSSSNGGPLPFQLSKGNPRTIFLPFFENFRENLVR